MGCFVRKKKDGKNEYFYEVTTTYDPSIKRSRQKVKYLGKNIDGKPARVRTCLPRRSYNYGELVPAQKAMDMLGIDEMLAGLLSENDSQALMAFVLNRVLRPVPSHLLESWYESTILCKTSPDLGLKSQQVSALLDRIGGSSIPDLFMDQMAKRHGIGSALVYDITSLSSSLGQIELLEYGHNRENNGLEQVNFGLVVDKKTGLPLMYDLYSGSIVDVVTLVNTLKKTRARGITGYCLVLDRGFYSKNNLREKDIVEKAFKTMKTDVQLKPLNVKKTRTLRGLVFACFIALIVRMRLLRLLKEKGLFPAYTMESLFLELEKIKKIELENGELITLEPTKKQKDILKALNLQI